MRGKILEYTDTTSIGYIRGEDGSKYRFLAEECTPTSPKPYTGAEAEFSPHGGEAKEVSVLPGSKQRESVPTPKRSKKVFSTVMTLAAIFTIAAVAAVIILSEREHRKVKELQDLYHSQIVEIADLLKNGKCTQAASVYSRAKTTRDAIYETGLYYSFESHAQQAHSLEIAECFVELHQLINATVVLEIDNVNDPEYLRKASIIYAKGGNRLKAKEAASKAQSLDPR
ncbi:MAG: hypothetical protein M0P91_02745 [Sulfuricurvum sp.]|jgi:hypothetical protein|uniref:hypothetical protein n=1 Tax=Sulfuricurvum sp. TaxID=2025608 RepID=UPI0025FDE67C|nr:hypothetical protein [Sulfuricurvum sp.]MCK9372090.1 hypothetical protein [Sulfuricurvum sp.]